MHTREFARLYTILGGEANLASGPAQEHSDTFDPYMLGTVWSFAMAPRANLKGYLKLSLVSCSTGLVQATSTRERIRLNIINRDTGNRLRYRQIDAETGEKVPKEGQVKGYKVADGTEAKYLKRAS
jgi:hypothetical protein